MKKTTVYLLITTSHRRDFYQEEREIKVFSSRRAAREAWEDKVREIAACEWLGEEIARHSGEDIYEDASMRYRRSVDDSDIFAATEIEEHEVV